MLRKIRICLAALFFIGITLLFAGIGHEWWGWMAKLQLLPSLLALNFAVLAGILLLTFIFGRLYCSVICPLGVFQDLVWKARTIISPAKRKFHKERLWVRLAVLALTTLAIIAGVQVLVALIAPYSAYGRMVRSIVGIVGGEASWQLIAVGAATLVIIGACAAVWGRDYCNTICPVGTLLSLVSRFSLLRPEIDSTKCVSCGRCEKKCRAACIDAENKKIDHSRCVDCFDCLESCKFDLIHYRFHGPKAEPKESSGVGRRAFLATLGGFTLAATTKAQEKKVDGGLARIEEKQTPERSERLVPFGAQSVKNFYERCTACQLCVSACPNNVLRPSTDLAHLLQPQMGYEKGYCRPECNICSTVCPAGAISPVEKGQKLTMHIGVAKVNLDLCVANTDGVGCGNCARHCPVGAIRMVNGEDGRRGPAVAEEICIGCGACEFLCPARPISAITIDGISVHRNG